MFMRKTLIFILLSTAIFLTGCNSAPNQAAITGVIAHNHSMEIPVGYTLTVEIEDTTKADSPAKSIAQKVVESQGDVLPMPFEVVYDPKKIKPDHSYSVKVMIADSAGEVVYSSSAVVPVITRGNPTQHIEVDVYLVGG
jgi:putative lipoprotein